MSMKIIRPTESYQLLLPANIRERTDGGVASYWLDGEPLLLQTSSYIRQAGTQINAEQRLRERISKHKETWRIWQERLHNDPTIDEAVGDFIDRNNLLWVHAYFVWPHLTVYATVSGPKDVVGNLNNWALKSLRDIALVVQ